MGSRKRRADKGEEDTARYVVIDAPGLVKRMFQEEGVNIVSCCLNFKLDGN